MHRINRQHLNPFVFNKISYKIMFANMSLYLSRWYRRAAFPQEAIPPKTHREGVVEHFPIWWGKAFFVIHKVPLKLERRDQNFYAFHKCFNRISISATITELRLIINKTMWQLRAAIVSWVGCLLKDSDVFILFAGKSQIPLKISI